MRAPQVDMACNVFANVPRYWSVGIPIAPLGSISCGFQSVAQLRSDRGMVFLNCLISAMVIALLTYSKMHTRGLWLALTHKSKGLLLEGRLLELQGSAIQSSHSLRWAVAPSFRPLLV